MLDYIDYEIIEYLKRNGRAQWKEIGRQIHLTGQAVADRVHRLEDLGIIERYTAIMDESKLGKPVIALITIFMKTTLHDELRQFLKSRTEVEEVHRISGEGCYWLKACFPANSDLTSFLNVLLRYGNYRVNLSIEKLE